VLQKKHLTKDQKSDLEAKRRGMLDMLSNMSRIGDPDCVVVQRLVDHIARLTRHCETYLVPTDNADAMSTIIRSVMIDVQWVMVNRHGNGTVLTSMSKEEVDRFYAACDALSERVKKERLEHYGRGQYSEFFCPDVMLVYQGDDTKTPSHELIVVMTEPDFQEEQTTRLHSNYVLGGIRDYRSDSEIISAARQKSTTWLVDGATRDQMRQVYKMTDSDVVTTPEECINTYGHGYFSIHKHPHWKQENYKHLVIAESPDGFQMIKNDDRTWAAMLDATMKCRARNPKVEQIRQVTLTIHLRARGSLLRQVYSTRSLTRAKAYSECHIMIAFFYTYLKLFNDFPRVFPTWDLILQFALDTHRMPRPEGRTTIE
jgi:hypothetical protein